MIDIFTLLSTSVEMCLLLLPSTEKIHTTVYLQALHLNNTTYADVSEKDYIYIYIVFFCWNGTNIKRLPKIAWGLLNPFVPDHESKDIFKIGQTVWLDNIYLVIGNIGLLFPSIYFRKKTAVRCAQQLNIEWDEKCMNIFKFIIKVMQRYKALKKIIGKIFN